MYYTMVVCARGEKSMVYCPWSIAVYSSKKRYYHRTLLAAKSLQLFSTHHNGAAYGRLFLLKG